MSALLWHKRGASRLPADIALALIPSLPRPHLERLVQSLIDRMDEADGDPDFEDALDSEDDVPTEFALAVASDGPGCAISDSYGIDDEDGCNMPSSYAHAERGPGCTISDPDRGADDDGELTGDESERDVTPAGRFG